MNQSYLSPNFDSRNGARIEYLILHYTGMVGAAAALERLSDPASKVSAHYTVDEDGNVYPHVEEAQRAWHAGASWWQGVTDLNTTSVGIEIVNTGHEYGYVAFPQKQMRAVADLCHDVMARHDIAPENVLGHSDIAPARKKDPGELFPWKAIAEEGIGLWPDVSDEDYVRSVSMDVERALHDFGYDPRARLLDNLYAFQRHFVPEAFETGQEGLPDSLTRARLYACLAGHFLVPRRSK